MSISGAAPQDLYGVKVDVKQWLSSEILGPFHGSANRHYINLGSPLYPPQSMMHTQRFSEDHPASLNDVRFTVDPRNVIPSEPVSDLIYAGFLEHLGRCIYGGIVDDPNDPSPADVLVKRPNGLGWRKDVIDVVKGLETPMMRWPGGMSTIG